MPRIRYLTKIYSKFLLHWETTPEHSAFCIPLPYLWIHGVGQPTKDLATVMASLATSSLVSWACTVFHNLLSLFICGFIMAIVPRSGHILRWCFINPGQWRHAVPHSHSFVLHSQCPGARHGGFKQIKQTNIPFYVDHNFILMIEERCEAQGARLGHHKGHNKTNIKHNISQKLYVKSSVGSVRSDLKWGVGSSEAGTQYHGWWPEKWRVHFTCQQSTINTALRSTQHPLLTSFFNWSSNFY